MRETAVFRFLARHRDAWLALTLMVLTAALFWPAREFSYINLDDYVYAADNPVVAGGLTWTSVRWAFTTVCQSWWLPLLWISYMADVQCFGAGPYGHHLVNILLHALNAGLLFGLLRRMTGSRWRSFFVAALFAWHPLRVESVAWITERKDVLSGMFFLLALGAYVRHAKRPSFLKMSGVTALALMGLMSKAIVIVLPPLLLVLDWWPLHRAGDPWGKGAWKAWRPLLLEKAPLFAMTLVFVLLNLRNHQIDVAGNNLTWPVRLGLIAPNYWVYLGKIFWPANLAVLYPEFDVANWPKACAALAGLGLLTLALGRVRRQAPYGIAGWLWFLVALLPVVRGVRLGLAGHADRFVYLPSIGLAFALVWSVAAFAERFRLRRWAVAGGTLVLAALAAATARELPVFRDSGTVFRQAMSIRPAHPAALLNYGVWKLAEGDLEDAEWNFRELLKVMPDFSQALGNLGVVLVQQGRADEARAVLEPELGKSETHWLVPGSWGMLLLYEGRAKEAIPFLRATVAQRPLEMGMRIELLRACMEAGEEAEAARHRAALLAQIGTTYANYGALFPHYLQAWKLGGARYAWAYYEKLAAKEWERNVPLLNNLAWLAATDGKTPAEIRPRAVVFAERAVELTKGESAPALDTLAAAQASAGNFEGALEAGERALALAASDAAQAEKIKGRLQLYREGKPYRE